MKDDASLGFAPETFEALGTRFALVDPDESVRAETLEGYSYEPGMAALLDRFCGAMDDPVVLDVGAHYGYFTCLLSTRHPRARILAFEPGGQQFGVLAHNIALNHSTASAMRIALSDGEGDVGFTDRTMKVKRGFPAETVASTTWDRFAERHGLTADVVKIDVHGAEGKVLAGMTAALAEQVRHVLIEVHAEYLLVDYSHGDILRLLREAGLELYEVAGFRTSSDPELVPMDEAAQAAFADSDAWTAEQIKYERVLYARRPGVPIA